MFYYYSLFTSLYSTIYWAVFKQKYDTFESAHTRFVCASFITDITHDHVTVISFTMITKLAHPNLCVLVWHWLLLSSESSSLCIMFSYSGFEPPFSLYSQRHENRISPPKHRILERWIRSITPDLSDNVLKKNIRFSFIWFHSICCFFILNTAWRRIAADIEVKRARRLQAYLKPIRKTQTKYQLPFKLQF